jgi:transposase
MVNWGLKHSPQGGSKVGISQEQKQQVVERMQAGQAWSEAIEQVGVKVCQSTAYRWGRCWRDQGEAGLSDERHGHMYKMTPEIQEWLKASCGQAPQVASSQVKKLIEEKFKVEISRGHLNRVRAELGVSRPKKSPG